MIGCFVVRIVIPTRNYTLLPSWHSATARMLRDQIQPEIRYCMTECDTILVAHFACRVLIVMGQPHQCNAVCERAVVGTGLVEWVGIVLESCYSSFEASV